MATMAVTFVLNHLLPLLETEIQLSEEVHREIQYMKQELEHMRSILQLADATDEVKENMKVCIMQMRDVAYDAEDVLVEFMLRLAHDHGDGCLGLVCKIIECIMSFQARHEISSSIKLISGRIERIYKRLPSDPFSSLDQSSSSSVTATPTWHDPRRDALLIEDTDLVGFEEPMMELISLMKDESELRTISVAGMAGLGKTTIVRKAYNNQQVKDHFCCHAWINVSESFEVKKLLKDLIRQLFEEKEKKVPEELDTMKEHELRKEIKEFLTEKSYVIVFDDIWDIVVLEAFKYALPSSNSGSRIVVTTRSNDIASHCKSTFGAVYDYDLKPLDQEKSLILFYKKAFGGKTCPPHLKDLSDKILARCEGSPLAIVSIGGLLATKDSTSRTDWQIVDQSLPELVTNEKFKSFNKVLSLSFNHLPYYLKPCFLYLGLFPEDYTFKSMTLIRMWIAEGFVEEQAGKTLEEVGESYLNELINRNLIQVAQTNIEGTIRRCRIHGLIRDVILSRSKDQIFGITVDEKTTSHPERIRRLSIHKCSDKIPSAKILSCLRSLILIKVHKFSNYGFIGGLRLLKVLDLRNVPLETFPDEVTNLFHLKYLCLRRTKIKELPNSIERLQKLETLDLKHACVAELPVGIFKLQKLRHLLIYSYNVNSGITSESVQGFKVGSEIGRLEALQKLCYIVPDNRCKNGGVIKELGRLNQLRKLGIRKLRSEDGGDLCRSIETMTSLRTLSLTSIEEEESFDLQSLRSPPPFLQKLYMRGRLDTLPHWIASSLRYLTNIELTWSNLRDDPLEVLKDLPNLVELDLIQAYTGELLCFKTGGFQRLKHLRLVKLEGLRRVKMETETMPLLEELTFSRCKLLKKVPFGIEHLVELKMLLFHDVPFEFIARLLRDGSEDGSKISQIPKVYFSFSQGGSRHNIYL